MISVGGVPPNVWGTLTVTPRITPAYQSVFALRDAIKTAMTIAVLEARDGELIVQNDVAVTVDPRGLPVTPGAVRMLSTGSDSHYCPRAFVIYDDATRWAVVEAWVQSTERACTAWGHIPKVSPSHAEW